jgi:hypothetical protein
VKVLYSEGVASHRGTESWTEVGNDEVSIDTMVTGLKNGSIAPESVPAIRLVEREGNLITIDNRRLEAFRQAGIDVPTRMASPAEIQQAIKQNKFSAGELGSDTIRIRGQ